MALADLPVMLLDIQASAAASAGGVILEVGWQRHPVSGPNADTQTHLAGRPTSEIHPRIARLTGLSTEQMQAARPLDDIWNHLEVAAGEIAARNDPPGARGDTLSICPVVAHYARFEAPYLAQLQPRNQTPAIRFDLICTHEIARRLLPGLPRKGLRAVAGYFGHDTIPLRRCRQHLTATGVIWTALAKQLSSHHGIASIAELKAWIEETPVPRPGARQFQVPMQMIRDLPDNPGIYRFLSCAGKPLYVGKAKDLNQRVGTYFQPRRHLPEHILEMLSRAATVKITPTPTALEAALLEQDVIKCLAPPYNIALAPHTTELQFWSRDLTSQAGQVDARHPWGPVPKGGPFTLLADLVKALAAGDDSRLTRLRVTLDHTRERSLDRTCLAAGLGLFHHTHQGLLQHMPPGRAIMTLGRQLWAKRRTDAKKHTKAAAEEEIPESPFLWTPERVCRSLEHAARHAGALLRRSRWLVLLGNASLVWGLPDTNTEAYRGLVFHSGRVIARENLSQVAAATQIKTPQQHPNWRPQNKTTYDRLRVATTELRRLIREERPVSIVLSGTGHPTLNRECLARLLSWI